MAFRRSILLELSSFYSGLSAPMGEYGAGDSDMLVRLLNGSFARLPTRCFCLVYALS